MKIKLPHPIGALTVAEHPIGSEQNLLARIVAKVRLIEQLNAEPVSEKPPIISADK